MSGDLTIRFVTRQDYAQWLPLWDGYNAFYGRSGATALDERITAVTWDRFFDAGPNPHFDLESYVAHRLRRSGIKKVETLNLDTYSD